MKKLLAELKSITPYYMIWIISIFVVGYLSITNLPWMPSFPYYDDIAGYGRGLASFSHFDGIHYLRLIQNGYDDMGSQAFFPVYPIFISLLTFSYFDPLYVAIFTNASLVLASLYLVSRMLPQSSISKFLLLFLSFPTSFYLLANYTESLFVFLVSLFFYLISEKKYLFAAIVAGVASGTRVVGVFLGLALLVELIQYYRLFKSSLSKYFWIYATSLLLISVSGLLLYCSYLYARYGDPLKFVHVMGMFGVGRSTGEVILLPQLMYRYLRILTTSPILSIIGLRALWELATLIIVSIWLYVARSKLSLPAMVFCLGVIIFPTLSGTLSAFPRYALVAVPLFVSLSRALTTKQVQFIALAQTLILLGAVSWYIQGIFVA